MIDLLKISEYKLGNRWKDACGAAKRMERKNV